jgi:rhodanese-related sulfurtransferase
VTVPEIDVHTFAELHRTGVALIDVRNPDEYQAGHVPGATLIPLPEVPERLAEVPSGQRVYLICAVGGRSKRAAEFLAAQGHDVTNIAGGTTGWVQAGLPITDGDQP